MAEKCGKCSKDFKDESDVVAKCIECKVSFHATCTRSGTSQSFTKSRNKTWKCDSCADETKPVKSAEESEDKKSILEAIRIMKIEINKNTDEKVSEVLASVNAIQEDIKSLQEAAHKMEQEQAKLADRCGSLEKANKKLAGEVLDLQLQLQDVEQHSRAANIEIDGLPTTDGENIYSCLQHIAHAIGVDFKKEDISIAHRLRVYSKRHRYPPIIAQFTCRRTKETWLAAAREKKNFVASDIHTSLPSTSVFINNHLTPHNKMLLGKARRLRKEGKVVFAGFFNGKVIVKGAEGEETVRANTLEDLDQFELKKAHPKK